MNIKRKITKMVLVTLIFLVSYGIGLPQEEKKKEYRELTRLIAEFKSMTQIQRLSLF